MKREKKYTDYLNALFIQFCDANGLTYEVEGIRKELTPEFADWILENNYRCLKYKEYLSYLNSDIDFEDIIEVDKGEYDTISTGSSNIKVVSRYGKTISQESLHFSLVKNKRTREVLPIYTDTEKTIYLPTERLILTHNPYEIDSIRNWYLICNQMIYDISVGMYGSVYDCDYQEKLQLLGELHNHLKDTTTLNLDFDMDSYFCSLTRKTKKKVLTK